MTYGTETKRHATETNRDSRYPVTYTVEEHCEHATPSDPFATVHHCRRRGEWRIRNYLGDRGKHREPYMKIFHYKEWDAISHHGFRQRVSKDRRP